MCFQSNWLTTALKLFWIKHFWILLLHWVLRKITLPYLVNLSLAIRTRLQNRINKNVPFCKIKVIFKSTTHLSKFFHFENKVPFNLLLTNVVYKFLCGRCNATYYSNTCRHLNIRVGEHSGVSSLTGKKLKAKTTTAIKDHITAIAITS